LLPSIQTLKDRAVFFTLVVPVATTNFVVVFIYFSFVEFQKFKVQNPAEKNRVSSLKLFAAVLTRLISG